MPGPEFIKDKLKKLYSLQKTIPKLIDDDSIKAQNLEDFYIKLQIILAADDTRGSLSNHDQISGKKLPIEMNALFDQVDDQHPAAKKLLIMGGAGVGKTTLLHYMSYRWGGSGGSSDGENNETQSLWNDRFDYVFRIRLKKLGTDTWKKAPGSIENPLEELIKEALQEQNSWLKINYREAYNKLNLGSCLKEIPDIVNGDKTKILLLLDGYDEIAHLVNDSNHIAQEVLVDTVEYPNVIMTTRTN